MIQQLMQSAYILTTHSWSSQKEITAGAERGFHTNQICRLERCRSHDRQLWVRSETPVPLGGVGALARKTRSLNRVSIVVKLNVWSYAWFVACQVSKGLTFLLHSTLSCSDSK